MNMKRAFLLIVFLFAGFLLLQAGCNRGRGESRGGMKPDSDITEAVKNKLKTDERVSASEIEVETKDGIVTLKGEVDTQADADRAIQLARSIPEVKSVNSNLKVEEVLTNKDVKERLEESEEKAKKTVEKPSEGITGMAEDAEITAKVKMKLAKDDVLSALKINVDTKNGEVTLTGTVKSELEAKRAIALAESVKDVKRVTSVLTVKP
jgi:hyperosmotically inducible periplasmic protein